MAQVIGPLHERRNELVRSERQAADLPPDLPPSRGLDKATALTAEQAAVGSGPETLDMLSKQMDELGRDRHLTHRLAGTSL